MRQNGSFRIKNMTGAKLAGLFKTSKCLELYIFCSREHCDAEINAFTKYENKSLINKIEFEERLKTSPMIAQDFSNKYLKLHDNHKFQDFDSSHCKYPLSYEKKLLEAFNEYFSNYISSI